MTSYSFTITNYYNTQESYEIQPPSSISEDLVEKEWVNIREHLDGSSSFDKIITGTKTNKKLSWQYMKNDDYKLLRSLVHNGIYYIKFNAPQVEIESVYYLELSGSPIEAAGGYKENIQLTLLKVFIDE